MTSLLIFVVAFPALVAALRLVDPSDHGHDSEGEGLDEWRDMVHKEIETMSSRINLDKDVHSTTRREDNPPAVVPSAPWMAEPVRTLLDGFIGSLGGKKKVAMLEFGCGGSTMHFSKNVKEYYSIESVPDWFHAVQSQIGNATNVHLELREPHVYTQASDPDLMKAHPLYELMSATANKKPWNHTARYTGFESYLLQAGRFGVHKYDVILIDGMARGAAAFYVLDLVDTNSRVVIHDAFADPDAPQNFLMCDLFQFYRVEAVVNQMEPYVSGGSVLILQKRKNKGHLTKTFGDHLDTLIRQGLKC